MLTLLRQPDLPVLGKGFLGFDLKPGTTIEDAKALVATLNDTVESTSYTDPRPNASIEKGKSYSAKAGSPNELVPACRG